ncbi:glycosyltransferase family 39 protein [Candidatus Woesearchaeota archaeon]|nr:glycosyltransferase family 39 protein [Candidatus Woesearchaeota archaeon]
MVEESKKDTAEKGTAEGKKGFGEGIEVVKETPPEEKDIEINFNLGKIFSFFKKKEKSGASEPAAQKTEHHHLHHATQDARKADAEGEDISLDIKSITNFLSKRGATILLILGILVAVWMTANVRLQPAQLHFAEEWAKNSVYNTIQNDIQNAISEQYPNLPDARKSQILADEISKAMKSKAYVFKTGQYTGQQIDIKSQIKGTADFIKDFYRDENGRPYSPDIDPYYWNRYAKNIIEKGHVGDEARNGVQWDTYQVAPLGRKISSYDFFFPYFLAYLYKATRLFNPSITLWSVQTTVYPVLITGLTVLLIFLLLRKVAGNIGGFFGALMAGLHAAYVNRTIHGDNDTIVVLFAILTLYFFVQAIYERKTIRQLAFAALAGLSVALYSIAWGGWWFVFVFVLAAAAAAIGAAITVKLLKTRPFGSIGSIAKAVKEELKGTAGKRFVIPTAAFLAATAAFVSAFSGFGKLLELPSLLFGVTTLKTPVLTALWPNVLTTVAELNEGNFDQVVSSITPSIFWISAASAAILALAAVMNFGFVKRLKGIEAREEKALYSVFFAMLVLVWFVGTIYASTKGIRFVLLLAPMAGIGFGITLGLAFRAAMWLNENFLRVNKLAAAATVFLILATAAYSTDMTKKAESIAKNDVPIINDAWYNSLTAIRDDSDNATKSAIITSWWDFGHHFKSIADRRVTFDGTTQQYPPAHWAGRFFMTKNETEAIGILRMLDCGSNSAFDELYNITNDFVGSIKILHELIATPSVEEAKSILTRKHNLTGEQAEKVLRYTHCQPPEGYVIASEDMIGKSGVWGHFGSWDFERGAIWQTLKGKNQKEAVAAMKETYNYSEEKARSIYGEIQSIRNDRDANNWIAPWPSFSGDTSGCQVLVRADNTTEGEEKIARCGNGLVVNLSTHDAYFPAEEGKILHPISFVYLTNETGTEELIEKTYESDTIPQRFSIILVPTGDWQGNSYSGYYAAVASPEQAAGMFTRMFLMEGRGLKHFKPLTHQRGMTGTNVYVYKADWESIRQQ